MNVVLPLKVVLDLIHCVDQITTALAQDPNYQEIMKLKKQFAVDIDIVYIMDNNGKQPDTTHHASDSGTNGQGSGGKEVS